MIKQELEAIRRQAVADGMVKVGLPTCDVRVDREWCFAERISATHARIASIPILCEHVNYGDVVEFREQDPPHALLKDFVCVKTQGSLTVFIFLKHGRLLRNLTPLELDAYAERMCQYLRASPESVRPLRLEYFGHLGRIAGAWPVWADLDEVSWNVDAFPG